MTMFQEQIQQIQKRFYTIDEFPFLPVERFSLDPLIAIETLDPSAVASYASTLTASQLDGLLLAFPNVDSRKLQEKTAAILAERLTLRLVKLFFSLYQHQYDSKPIAYLASVISQAAEKKGLESEQVRFLSGFTGETDAFGKINDHIFGVCLELETYFRTYGIRVDSRLAFRVRKECFLAADSNSFHHNSRQLTYHIDHTPPGELTDIVARYLSEVSMMDFHEGVNLSILAALGEPMASIEWAPFSLELRTKFAQWVFLHRLKLHSLGYPQKYKVLSKYFERIVSSYPLEDGAVLVIDFGDIVVADIKEKPYSYFYKRREFDKDMAKWKTEEILPAFLRMDRDQTTARDYIIEEMDGICLQLQYEGVDFLYIEELMDIKMGLEPEFRRRKLKKKG